MSAGGTRQQLISCLTVRGLDYAFFGSLISRLIDHVSEMHHGPLAIVWSKWCWTGHNLLTLLFCCSLLTLGYPWGFKCFQIQHILAMFSQYLRLRKMILFCLAIQEPERQYMHIGTMVEFAFALVAKLDVINKHSFNDFKLRVGMYYRIFMIMSWRKGRTQHNVQAD